MSSPGSWTADLAARYELLEEAGRGGMGVVYKAKDRETGEIVALKILKPEIATDRIAAERFLNEVRLSRRITHKNVCRVYEFTRAGSTAYLSMEYVEGESLRALLERIGAVAAAELESAKRSIVASFALTLEQLAQDVSYMTIRQIYGLSPDYWDRYPEKIMAITAEDVQRVSAKYLATDRLQIVAVGDASKLEPLLAAKAPVTKH